MDEAGSPKDDDVLSGLPAEQGEEAEPLGPPTTEPDAEAPPPDDLPGMPKPGEEPSTAG